MASIEDFVEYTSFLLAGNDNFDSNRNKFTVCRYGIEIAINGGLGNFDPGGIVTTNEIDNYAVFRRQTNFPADTAYSDWYINSSYGGGQTGFDRPGIAEDLGKLWNIYFDNYSR